MKGLTEISRFAVNGKTFFFNKGEASNGAPYLAINALYGKGNKERLVLFEPHLFGFYKNFAVAFEEMTGLAIGSAPPEPVEEEPEAATPRLPLQCSGCGRGADQSKVVWRAINDWQVVCECGRERFNSQRW